MKNDVKEMLCSSNTHVPCLPAQSQTKLYDSKSYDWQQCTRTAAAPAPVVWGKH